MTDVEKLEEILKATRAQADRTKKALAAYLDAIFKLEKLILETKEETYAYKSN